MPTRRAVLVGGASVVAMACNPVRHTAARTPPVYEKFAVALGQRHGELRAHLDRVTQSATVEANDAAKTDADIEAFCTELLDHHKSEDSFFFPAFRNAGRMRSADVAFLDARDAEHRDVHRLCLELRDVSSAHRRSALATRAWRTEVRRLAAELAILAAPHFRIEESTLTAEHVALLLTPAELIDVYRDMGQNWNRR
jgi:iron-sulfur cluster repair protein YtfE (RIC family)